MKDGPFEGFDRAQNEDLLVNGLIREPRARPVVQAGRPYDRVTAEAQLAPEELEADGYTLEGEVG